MLPLYHLYAIFRGLSLGLYIPLQVTFLFENGCSALHIGLLGTMMELCKFIFELPTGKFTDTHGPKIPLILSGVLGALLWLGYPLFSSSLMIFYICSMLLGISEAMFTGSLESWIMQYVGKEQITKSVLNNTKYMILASVIAGFISGWLYKSSILYCFIVISLINLIKAFIPFLEKNQLKKLVIHKEKRLKSSIVKCTQYIWKLPILRKVLISSFFVTMACDMVLRYYQPFAITKGISTEYIGYIYSFAAIIAWTIITLGAHYDKIINRYPLLSISMLDLFGAISCIILVCTAYGKIIIGMLSLLLAIEDMRTPVVRSLISKLTYQFNYKALIFSIYSIVESTGEILAGILFGIIIDYYGLHAGFITSIVLFSISACFCIPSFKKK